MQKIDSKESFTADLNENKPSIQLNKSNKIVSNNFKKNMENLANNNINFFGNNINNNSNNLFNSNTSKGFSKDLPFNYNSNSNLNFSNVNMIKDPESMSHISNVNDIESNINKRLDSKNFTLNYDDNRLITLKPEDYVDTFENKLDFTGVTFNSTKNKNKYNENNFMMTNNNSELANTNEQLTNLFDNIENNNKMKKNYKENKNKLDFNFNYNIYENTNEKLNNIDNNNKNEARCNIKNKKQNSNLNDDVYNMPLQQKKNKNYAIGASKINDSYLKDALIESNKKNPNKGSKNIISEYFYDEDTKPLAVFFSSKNDIIANLNEKRFNETFEKGNLTTFANNNSFNQNNFYGNNNNFENNIYETLNSDGDVVNVNNNTLTLHSINTDKRGGKNFYGKSAKSKKISFDLQTLNNSVSQQGTYKRNESFIKVQLYFLLL